MRLDTASSTDVSILFALPEEAAPFLKHNTDLPSFSISGMGPANSAHAAKQLLESAPGKSLLICGFAGSLSPALVPGSFIVAQRVCSTAPGAISYANNDSKLMSRAVSAFRAARQEWEAMPLVSADHVVITAAEKQQLASQTMAGAVDMETAAAVAVADKQGVPWLAVRVITDGVDDTLPLDFNTFVGPDGNLSQGRVALAALTHPWKIPALIRLGSRSSLAANNLAAFLKAFLEALP